jgi:hypothetical protein
MHRQLAVAATLLFIAHGTISAQQVSPTPLGPRLSRSSDPFTEIVGAHELPDGRVLVADLRERRIALIDFEKAAISNVAREGSGPLEYTATFSILRWLGDTVLVYGRSDFLKIAPDGRPAGKFVYTMVRGAGGISPPRFADAEGRIYFETTDPLQQNTDGGFIAPIGGNVLRWDPRTGKSDSVARISHRDPKQPLVRPWRPFPARDGVGVLRDGRVAIARAQNYRVEIWRDGKLVTEGPRQDYAAIPVGAAERDAFRDLRARRPAGAQMSGPPPTTPRTGAEREAARRSLNLPDEAFPPALPPIVEERSMLVDPNGTIWVARSHRANDADRVYDLFNDRGQLVRRVSVPNRGRVVGFGKASVYVVTPDSDDLEWVERYALPR